LCKKPEKLQKKIETRVTEIVKGIIKFLPYGFDVDLGKTENPELEEKQRRLIFFIANPSFFNNFCNSSLPLAMGVAACEQANQLDKQRLLSASVTF